MNHNFVVDGYTVYAETRLGQAGAFKVSNCYVFVHTDSDQGILTPKNGWTTHTRQFTKQIPKGPNFKSHLVASVYEGLYAINAESGSDEDIPTVWNPDGVPDFVEAWRNPSVRDDQMMAEVDEILAEGKGIQVSSEEGLRKIGAAYLIESVNRLLKLGMPAEEILEIVRKAAGTPTT